LGQHCYSSLFVEPLYIDKLKLLIFESQAILEAVPVVPAFGPAAWEIPAGRMMQDPLDELHLFGERNCPDGATSTRPRLDETALPDCRPAVARALPEHGSARPRLRGRAISHRIVLIRQRNSYGTRCSRFAAHVRACRDKCRDKRLRFATRPCRPGINPAYLFECQVNPVIA